MPNILVVYMGFYSLFDIVLHFYKHRTLFIIIITIQSRIVGCLRCTKTSFEVYAAVVVIAVVVCIVSIVIALRQIVQVISDTLWSIMRWLGTKLD